MGHWLAQEGTKYCILAIVCILCVVLNCRCCLYDEWLLLAILFALYPTTLEGIWQVLSSGIQIVFHAVFGDYIRVPQNPVCAFSIDTQSIFAFFVLLLFITVRVIKYSCFRPSNLS